MVSGWIVYSTETFVCSAESFFTRSIKCFSSLGYDIETSLYEKSIDKSSYYHMIKNDKSPW